MQSVVTKPHKGGKPAKTDVFDEFILWFALPSAQKKLSGIETIGSFAEKNDVNPTTLHRWKQRPEFEVRVRDLRKRWAFDKTSDVIESVYKSAIKGNDKSQKLWFQLFEGFSERTENVQTQQVELSVNDLRFLIQGFSPEEQEKYYGYIREIIDRAAITATEIERGQIPANLQYVESSAADITEDIEGSVSDEAHINAQYIPEHRTDEIPSGDQIGIRKDLVGQISPHYHQSSARGWEIQTAWNIRLRRLVLAETQGCQHGRISSAGDDCL